uniref:Uncharacterized protein n=1 Tax=Aegilops tauschii subsp. strangulata TaxID=200361 RepID=A0A453PLN5_AEGTS
IRMFCTYVFFRLGSHKRHHYAVFQLVSQLTRATYLPLLSSSSSLVATTTPKLLIRAA